MCAAKNNRSLIRNYMEVKTFGSLRSAKKVIERVNSHRTTTTSSSSIDSRHHNPYRISYPIDIGSFPLCLDFSTHVDTSTAQPAQPLYNNDDITDIAFPLEDEGRNLIPSPLFSRSSRPTFSDDEFVEIGVARTARVMRPRLCRLGRRGRPTTIIDGELQVMFSAGRSAGTKRRREAEGGISQLPLGLGLGIAAGGGSLRRARGGPALIDQGWL